MADPTRSPEPQPPSTPGWVKVFGIIAIVLVVLVVVMLIAGGDHGPSRHQPAGNLGDHTRLVQHSL